MSAPSLLDAGGRTDAARWFHTVKDGGSASSVGMPSAMPAFGDVLDDGTIWAILLLLEDLRAGPAPSASGAVLYQTRCTVCHGAAGAGDGPLASSLVPRPRDFTRAAYRFRSTPSGAAPLDADLRRTLDHGLGVTAMGSFARLGHGALAAVIGEIEAFAPARFATPRQAAAGAQAPGDTAALRARGRLVYDEARCWQCHGQAGRGDGPSARSLKDDLGQASLPANLTKRWQLKGGADVADIQRTVTTGLNGTPMPSYGDALDVADLWAVASYVASLGHERPRFPSTVRASVVEGPVPRDPTDARWERLETTTVPLGPQLFDEPRWSRPSIDAVDVTVAVSVDEIAFALAWDDRFRDESAEDAAGANDVDDAERLGRWRLPDEIALQFPGSTTLSGLPPVHLGDAAHPILRWTWSASRPEVRVTVIAGPRSQQARGAAGVESAAAFDDGRWHAVLVGRRAALFPAGGERVFALQAWDGATGESGRRHALSSWIRLALP